MVFVSIFVLFCGGLLEVESFEGGLRSSMRVAIGVYGSGGSRVVGLLCVVEVFGSCCFIGWVFDVVTVSFCDREEGDLWVFNFFLLLNSTFSRECSNPDICMSESWPSVPFPSSKVAFDSTLCVFSVSCANSDFFGAILLSKPAQPDFGLISWVMLSSNRQKEIGPLIMYLLFLHFPVAYRSPCDCGWVVSHKLLEASKVPPFPPLLSCHVVLVS